jgi:hypothetical protein
LQEVVVTALGNQKRKMEVGYLTTRSANGRALGSALMWKGGGLTVYNSPSNGFSHDLKDEEDEFSRDGYDKITENRFLKATGQSFVNIFH